LPWQGLKKKKGENHLEIIGNTKMCTSIESLCDGVPECFAEYIKYCRALKFDEAPDYKYLRQIMVDGCVKSGTVAKFEWFE